MPRCERCDAELDAGRFCTNCGHRVGTPVDPADRIVRADPAVPLPEQRPTRPAWLVPAAVVLALVLLVVVIALVAGGGDDEPAGTAREAAARDDDTSATTEAVPASEHEDITALATADAPVTATATQDLDGTTVTYDPAFLLDGKPRTAWRMAGDGRGTELTFTFDSAVTLSEVGLLNGYAKRVEGVDWYPHNRRVQRVEWVFDDGTAVRQRLAERRRVQSVPVEPVVTRTVTLRILRVTPPGPGLMGRDYTAISDVSFTGAAG